MSIKDRVVTLLTDFGEEMGYVGQMKGVLLSHNPSVNIVDLTHSVPPQNIAAGAMILEQCYPYFPTGTIHLCVVDPGVGTDRPPVIVETEKAVFVGPDNGLFGFLQKQSLVREVYTIRNRRYFLEELSDTFHGRDIFAPVCGYLSLGYPADEFGPPGDRLVVLPDASLKIVGNELLGEILAIDAFGNLITSIPSESLDNYLSAHPGEDVFAWCGDHHIPIRNTFADVPDGSLLAYVGSGRNLEIAVNSGSAAKAIGAELGQPVKLTVF